MLSNTTFDYFSAKSESFSTSVWGFAILELSFNFGVD